MPIQKKRNVGPVVVPAQNLQPVLTVEPLLLDISAAARMLSSTIWTVRNLLWSKKIPFIKIGRRFLIDPADLRDFIARQKSDQIAA